MTIEDALEEMRKKEEQKKQEEQQRIDEENNKLAEEKKRQIEKENQTMTEQLREYKKNIETEAKEKQKEIIRTHLRATFNLWPGEIKDDIDRGIVGLVTSQEFEDIYLNTLILKDTVKRIEYVQMKFIQKGLMTAYTDYTEVFIRMAPLGLNITCPYFKKTGKTIDTCLIEGTENLIDTICQGRHDTCTIFEENAKKFITGEKPTIHPPKIYKAPQIIISETERQQKETELIREIEIYWRGDE